jgi:hypothetical protein
VNSELLAQYSKDIRTENGLPQSLFDEVEAVIRDYCFYALLRHGEQVWIDGIDGPVSWHFNNDYLDANAHVTVCFKQGRDWADDCYLDEVPAEFLMHLLATIRRRRPLWDQKPEAVENAAMRYIRATEADAVEKELTRSLSLSVLPYTHTSVVNRRRHHDL